MALRFGFACVVATGLGAMVQAAFPTGCVGTGAVYLDPIPGMDFPLNISSAELCQAECVETVNCTHFGFWPDDLHCWLGGTGTEDLRTTASANTIFGPKVCEDPPLPCTEKPADSFPGVSMAADWPKIGYQPKTLQCYDGSCTAVTTLESTADGWPGLCKQLTLVTLSDGQTCESSCLEDPSCPGFQVGRDDTCWQGIGENCYSTDPWDPTFAPVAKRFQRGEITVLKDLTTLRLQGLDKVFNDTEFQAMSLESAKKACANICYSILKCEYWSLNNETGTGGGCYVDASSRVPYPLLETSMLIGGPNWIAGEYIQRYCPPEEAPIEEDEGMPWWLVILLCLLLAVALIIAAALVYYFCVVKKKSSKKGKSKKKKGGRTQTTSSAAAPLVAAPAQMVAYPMPAYQLVPANQVAVATQQVPVAMAQPLQVVETAYPNFSYAAASPSVTYTTAPAVIEAAPAAPVAYTSASAAAPVAYVSGAAPAAGTAPAGYASVTAPAGYASVTAPAGYASVTAPAI